MLPLRFDPAAGVLQRPRRGAGTRAAPGDAHVTLCPEEEAELPTLDRKRLSELPELGQALLFATRQAEAASLR